MKTEELFSRFMGVVFVLFLIATATFFILPEEHVQAQNAGTVGIQTKMVPVFKSQTANLSSGGYWGCGIGGTATPCSAFPDNGFAANYLSYCNTGFTGTIDVEWSPTGSAPYYPLAIATWALEDSSCHKLQVGGYYPNMRSTVTVWGGSVSAWYTASSAPISYFPPALTSNGPGSPVVCDQTNTNSSTTGATRLLIPPIRATDNVIICGATLSFATAPTGGSVYFAWSASSACTSLTGSVWAMNTPSTTPQTLSIPYPINSPTSFYNNACLVNSSGATVQVSTTYVSLPVQ
jgi:hypothetical protein